MRVYEEYESAKEKRAAQNGAKRMKPTGKARAYLLVVPENGRNSQGHYEGVGTVFDQPPGAEDTRLASTAINLDFLRENCRIVGRRYLPDQWKRAFAHWIEDGEKLFR